MPEISRRLARNVQTVKGWRSSGFLPPQKWNVGGRPLWDWREVEAWAAAGLPRRGRPKSRTPQPLPGLPSRTNENRGRGADRLDRGASGSAAADRVGLERLERLERLVDRSLIVAGKISGDALATIRDQRLYRATHRSFEAFVKERFGLTIEAAERFIASGDHLARS
jgi:hypothetical protein